MGILIQQDDGQLIPYTETNHGWSAPYYGLNTTYSAVIDRNGGVLGIRDSEGKPVPMSNLMADYLQKTISADLYGLKRGNPDLFNSLDQLRTRRSVDRNPHNPYAVGSRYAPDDNPTTFLENGSGTPAPDQPPQYGGPLVRRQRLQEAIENSNANNPWLGGIYGSRRPGLGLVEENPQPQAPAKSAGKPRKVRQGRSTGGTYSTPKPTPMYNPDNVSLAYSLGNTPISKGMRDQALIDKWNLEHGRTGSNTYASAGVAKGGVVSPATMMRTSGVQPVQAAYGNNAPMGEGFDYTITYDPMSNSMRPNDSYSYYDPSRNASSGGDLTLTYDPMTGQMVRR